MLSAPTSERSTVTPLLAKEPLSTMPINLMMCVYVRSGRGESICLSQDGISTRVAGRIGDESNLIHLLVRKHLYLCVCCYGRSNHA